MSLSYRDKDYATDKYRIARGFLGRTLVQRWIEYPNKLRSTWKTVTWKDSHTILIGQER